MQNEWIDLREAARLLGYQTAVLRDAIKRSAFRVFGTNYISSELGPSRIDGKDVCSIDHLTNTLNISDPVDTPWSAKSLAREITFHNVQISKQGFLTYLREVPGYALSNNAKPKSNRGRTPGSGKIDDNKWLILMNGLLTSNQATSINDAAKKIVEKYSSEIQGGGTKQSKVDRLRQGYSRSEFGSN